MQSTSLPKHVGIIMDGNRRWAKARGLSSFKGHKKGYDQALVIAEHAFARGIKYLTLFAFSTENWNRSEKEVAYLMGLLKKMITQQAKVLHTKKIRIKVIGTRERVSRDIVRAIDQAEQLTRVNTAGTLLIAFNYGGRKELVDAVQGALRVKAKVATEQLLESHLYTAGIPDPDLIIRTSGEQRLSGFLLWQSAYSELYFTKVHWPAFTAKHFDTALTEYQRRKRRFGS